MDYSKSTTGRFDVASWTEQAYVDIDGEGTTAGDMYYPTRGLSHAQVGYTYRGDVEGSSTLAYLIAYRPDGAPIFGMERFTGSIDGHEGSCVFLHTGTQDAGSVRARLEVLPGMGTGGLERLRGAATVEIAGHSDDGYLIELAYDLD